MVTVGSCQERRLAAVETSWFCYGDACCGPTVAGPRRAVWPLGRPRTRRGRPATPIPPSQMEKAAQIPGGGAPDACVVNEYWRDA
jgi:hypothetical protein